MPSAIEAELTKKTKYKTPSGGFNNRQDALAALAKHSNKIKDDAFDDASDEAAGWVTKAIKAINEKRPIDDPGDKAETEDEERDEEAAEEAEAEAEAEAQEAAQEAVAETEAEEEAEEPAPPPAKPKKSHAAQKYEEPVPLVKGKALEAIKTRYDNLTGEKDRYGIMIGTKTHDAVKMYEKGVTAGELMEKLGGRFYNVLRQLSANGHLIEQDPQTHVFTLTHRDEVPSNKQFDATARMKRAKKQRHKK